MSSQRRNVRFTPRRLPGRWKLGFALDVHTVSSSFVGYDEFGHERFETKRTELGELLYRLKYDHHQAALAPIITAAATFIERRRLRPESLIPVPPSRRRRQQPVLEIVNALGSRLSLPVIQALQRKRPTQELKSIHDFSERIRLLEDAFALTRDAVRIKGTRVLLIDDLWRSGATLNAAANLLTDEAGVGELIVLAITKTRSNR